MKRAALFSVLLLLVAVTSMGGNGVLTRASASPQFDITTLAGKVASVNSTAGLQIRFSGFIEEQADISDQAPNPEPFSVITPTHVLSSPLDGASVTPPAVTVNRDGAGAPQNETTIAVDPNNPLRVVAAANDYVTRTWTCFVSGTPCSRLGDAYSGTYYSNDGGATWCCKSTGPSDLGTLIPGVEHLTGGPYDAGGDPALTFDSRGNVYYAGLGFDRAASPNTVAVNKGTFDGNGKLTWGPPTFINQTTSHAIFNDKEWIAADSHVASPFRDHVYVTWTRFIFNPINGDYVQSPIFFAKSVDGGETFTDPVSIVDNVLYDQGSRPVVGPDGTVYVFWEGARRHDPLNSIWVVKSTDGGFSWSKPLAISAVVDILPPANTRFRVNSFPAAAAAPNGDVFVIWSSQVSNSGGLCPTRTNVGCHAAAFHSKSTDFGAQWSAPALAFPTVDASTRTAVGYPVTQPDGSGTLTAPNPRRVDTFFPAIAISSSGRVYASAYAADLVSPWQLCQPRPLTQPVPVSRIDCLALDNYVHNARLDYVVTNLGTGETRTVSTHPINTRNGFGGGFIGDYTDITAGSDDTFHAFWTDTNNKQTVVWWYGFQFSPTLINQEDVVVGSGNF